MQPLDLLVESCPGAGSASEVGARATSTNTGDGTSSKNPLLDVAAVHGACVIMRHITKCSWEEIGRTFFLHPDTVRKMVNAIEKEAGSNSIIDMMYTVHRRQDAKSEQRGAPAKIPEGSALSERLRELYHQDEKHRKKTPPKIAQELGYDISSSSAYRIFHDHFNFVPHKGTKL